MRSPLLLLGLSWVWLAGPAQADPSNTQTCPKLNIEAVIALIDANRDGRLTREEWSTAKAPLNSYNSLESKQSLGFVPADVFRAETPPPGIDANGDCQLTLKEFQDLDAKMGPPPGS